MGCHNWMNNNPEGKHILKIKKEFPFSSYLENRRSEIDAGLYPKHHLWELML